MAELFRYIQQAFVIPSATRAIDVGSESDLQKDLRGDISQQVPTEQIRGKASDFILEHFSSLLADPFHSGAQYLSFGTRLLTLHSPGTDPIEDLIEEVFGKESSPLVRSEPFLSDKALLNDALVCVKIATAFDRVNAHNLVAMRQAIAFIEDFDAGKVTDFTAEVLRKTLRRPIRIPSEFVESLTVIPDRHQSPPPPDPAIEAAAGQRAVLMAEQGHLKSAYEAIMGLPPGQFELTPMSDQKPTGETAGPRSGKDGVGSSGSSDTDSAPPTFLAVPKAAIERLGGDVRKTLEEANIDIEGASVFHVITAIKRQWQDVSRQLAPYQVPAPAKVLRVGVHVFAVQNSAPTTAPATKEAL